MRSSWLEINLAQLTGNASTILKALPDTVEPIFVVKSNAYNHGLKATVRAAAEAGAKRFAVAYLEEALELREALPSTEILVLGAIFAEEVELALAHQITPTCSSFEQAHALNDAAAKVGEILPVHLKIDTGMGRLGFLPEVLTAQLSELVAFENISIQGVCSHFSRMDSQNDPFAEQQSIRFKASVGQLESALGRRLFRHFSSSRAALLSDSFDFDAIRPGIALYGYGAADPAGRFYTAPALSWKTQVMAIKSVPAGTAVGYYGAHTTLRETKIAQLCCGYADGYNRALSNRGDVIVRGRRCPVIGRISMNWITIDVTDLPVVEVGDIATLIGQDGPERITAKELSELCHTIPYEILTNIRADLPRSYQGTE